MGVFVTGAGGGAPDWPVGAGMGVEGLVSSDGKTMNLLNGCM